jgi:hypothetical protein
LYFSKIPNFSSKLFLTYMKKQNRKGKLNWKRGLRPFSPHRPSAIVSPGPIPCVSRPVTVPTSRSPPAGIHLSGPSFPNPPLLLTHVSSLASSPSLRRPCVDSFSPQCFHLCAHAREPSHRLLMPYSVVSVLPAALLGHRYTAEMPTPGAR